MWTYLRVLLLITSIRVILLGLLRPVNGGHMSVWHCGNYLSNSTVSNSKYWNIQITYRLQILINTYSNEQKYVST
jgi:hypothetical protein